MEKIKQGQVLALDQAMADYNNFIKKDKDVAVTEERMIKLSGSVKYTILFNSNKIVKKAEALRTIASDKFRWFGGETKVDDATGFTVMRFVKPEEESEKPKKPSKKEKDNTLGEELKKKEDEEEAAKVYSKEKKEEYEKWSEEFAEEEISEKIELRTIKPNTQDIQLLPDSMVSIYMELGLLEEPKEEGEKGKKS